MKRLLVILSILLIFVVFKVSEAATWKNLVDHPVELENDAAEIIKVNILNLHGEAEEIKLGDMHAQVHKMIDHQPNGSKARSIVSSNIDIQANHLDFHPLATIRGTADAGFTQQFSNRKTDKGVLDASEDADGNRQVQTSLVDANGEPLSLGADQFNAYKGWADSVTSEVREKWGDRENFRYTISHNGAVVAYTAMREHPVHSGRGFSFNPLVVVGIKEREKARNFLMEEAAGLEKQKQGNPDKAAILKMFDPYAEADGDSYNGQGKSMDKTIPHIYVDTDMPAARIAQADPGVYNFGVLLAENDSYSAEAGDTHKALMYLSHTASTIKWYVKASGETGKGTLMETDTNTDEASYSHTFASDASGDYVITAVVTSTTGSYEGSYTVTVGDGTSTTTTTPSTPSSTLSPSNSSYSATAGDNHTASFSSSVAYSSVSWYVKTPSDTSAVYQRTDTGNGSSTSASYAYTFPSGTSGDYVFKAVGTIGSTGFDMSYTVTVSTSTSTPAPSPTPTPTPPSTPPSVSLELESESLTLGNTIVATLTLGAAPSYVFWYLQSPWESAPGTLMSQDTSGSLTSLFSRSTDGWNNTGAYAITVSGTWASDGSAFTQSAWITLSQ